MVVASQRDYSCFCGAEGDIWDDTHKTDAESPLCVSAAIFLLSVRPRRRDSEGGDQELGLASGAIGVQAAAAEGVHSLGHTQTLVCHMAASHNEGH